MEELDELVPLPVRRYAYRVATAAAPILTGYGVVSESTAALWLGLAGAVLATGGNAMASAYTRKPKDGPTGPEDFADLREER